MMNCKLTLTGFFLHPIKKAHVLVCVIVLISLGGCAQIELIDLDPKGPVAKAIDELFWLAVLLMTLVLIAVFVLTIWIVTRYRASRQPADLHYEWTEPVWLEPILWLIPGLIVLGLGTMSWIYTHRLDPCKPLDYPGKPLQIEAIALDWKWLFIYPEQNIATINQIAFPVNYPVTFRITSGTVMNSFFIPRLAGQIYAMAGMETQLHLIAKQTGRYFGENIQYSGKGFPYQHFEAVAMSNKDFASWADKAKQTQLNLDIVRYRQLVKPTIDNRMEYFAPVAPKLFDQIMMEFRDGSGQKQDLKKSARERE